MNKRFFVYVTRYALSEGIEQREVNPGLDDSYVVDCVYTHMLYFTEGKDWHRT